MPLSLREVLLVLQANPGQSVVREGLPYAITLALAALLSALSQNRTQFLSTKTGITIRAALTSAIYDHALRLTPEGRAGLTAGEVTNLVAVDTQKLYDVMLEAHNMWSCPLIIVVVTILLWRIMGPELTIGVLALILVVPIVKFFVGRMLAIRKERAHLTDVRINILTSMLQGIQVTKLNHYESKIEEYVGSVRDKEMKLLRKELAMWGWVLSFAVVSPLVAACFSFSFYSLVSDANLVTPAETFSSLLLFSILRFPINMTARLVGKLAQAAEAVRRITFFLQREARSGTEKSTSGHLVDDDSGHVVVDLKNGTFTIKPEDDALSLAAVSETDDSAKKQKQETDTPPPPESSAFIQPSFSIRNVNLQVAKSQVVAVVGRVGSGKTLLLRALLGELPSSISTQVQLKGRLSYAAQQPFILNASVRANVLFGSDFDEARYEEVLDACCLRQDVQRLGPAGDLTEIGERGVTISGGQKQRVALARAIYAEPDITFLDDCFSALDSSTGGMVFENLFRSETGLLRKSGTILVTHAIHFLQHVDQILIMNDGTPAFCGTWEELQATKTNGSHQGLAVIQQSPYDDSTMPKRRRIAGLLSKEGMIEKDGFIMTVEERRYGVSSIRIWAEWVKNAGGWTFLLLQLLFLGLDRLFYVASDWWIALWADGAFESVEAFGQTFPPQTDGHAAQVQYVSIYSVIILLSVLASVVRSQWAVAGGARCAETMFKAMTKRVLRAPMSYFDTTPLGRILNRFTYDVEVLDIELSVSMAGVMISFSWLFSAIVVMAAVLPWILLGIVPVTFAYYFLQLYYRMSGPDLQRIDATSRTPIQASLAEGLEGATTIRAFRKEEKFSLEFQKSVDRNSSAMLNFTAAQRWLGLRIESLGASVSLTLSLLIVCANDSLLIPPGLVGLVIQWSILFTAALNFFFLRFTESEARITSIERIHETTTLPQEAAWETDPSKVVLDKSWPAKGELVFDNVSMRYRDGLPLSLDSVSFCLNPGTRCGVVGRTGSGKTSLTAALFRLVEIESGCITLDGVDLSTIGLSDLRGRPNCLRMIAQDPVLFAGTLRDCIDPFHCETDEKVLEALQAVNHRGSKERGMDILNEQVDEGGLNYSVGERQLLCLARAIVEEPRLLVLDEATASIDSATDAFIQEMVRTRFQSTTLVTIAHRIHTVIDSDRILVMDDGHAVEFGRPADLLQDPNSILSSLVDATGLESAAELRRIAEEHAHG